MTFLDWLDANKSREFCYLRATKANYLATCREAYRMGKDLSDEAGLAIEVGQQAVDAYLAGRVMLFQRRINDHFFEYLAIRRSGEPPELFEQWKWKDWQRTLTAPVKRREKRERAKAAA